MKYQLAPSFLHLNEPLKEGTKNGLDSRYSLPRWLISPTWGMGRGESTNKHLVFLIVVCPMNLKPCEIRRWVGFSQGAVQHS